jgi:hypothetical protein
LALGLVVFSGDFGENWCFERGVLMVWLWWNAWWMWCLSNQFLGVERYAMDFIFIFQASRFGIAASRTTSH